MKYDEIKNNTENINKKKNEIKKETEKIFKNRVDTGSIKVKDLYVKDLNKIYTEIYENVEKKLG